MTKKFVPIECDIQLVWNFLDRFGKYIAISPVSRKFIFKGQTGKCFNNARRFSNYDRENVKYVEGMAGDPKGSGTLHAWNKLLPGAVWWLRSEIYVDITWPIINQMEVPFYCGVEFDLDFAYKVTAKQWEDLGIEIVNGKNKSPLPEGHGGFSVLTYEPLLLGKVPPYTW